MQPPKSHRKRGRNGLHGPEQSQRSQPRKTADGAPQSGPARGREMAANKRILFDWKVSPSKSVSLAALLQDSWIITAITVRQTRPCADLKPVRKRGNIRTTGKLETASQERGNSSFVRHAFRRGNLPFLRQTADRPQLDSGDYGRPPQCAFENGKAQKTPATSITDTSPIRSIMSGIPSFWETKPCFPIYGDTQPLMQSARLGRAEFFAPKFLNTLTTFRQSMPGHHLPAFSCRSEGVS
jgi:hypothetical protein